MASNWFLRLAVLFALTGMGLGVFMGATHDFTYVGVHVHINLVGHGAFRRDCLPGGGPQAGCGIGKGVAAYTSFRMDLTGSLKV